MSELREKIDDVCAYFMELGMGINNVDNSPISEKAEKAKKELIQLIQAERTKEKEEVIDEVDDKLATYWDSTMGSNTVYFHEIRRILDELKQSLEKGKNENTNNR